MLEGLLMNTIVVQLSNRAWTMEAMHLACALARNIGGEIALLHLAPANNPGLLGWGVTPPTPAEYEQMKDYASVAEDYGVAFTVQPMQYVSMPDALAQVAEVLNAVALFAHIPASRVAVWRRFQLWNIRRQMHHCRLYTLDADQPELADEYVAPAAVWER
jgi:hypothetical protein